MRRRATLGLNVFEERTVPAALLVRNGVLICNGTGVGDTVRVSYVDGRYEAQVNQRNMIAPDAWVTKVSIRTGCGPDIVIVDESVTVPCDIRTGSGNDYVEGGSGNDIIWGSIGADTLKGGAGDDRIFGSWHADLLYGGGGADWLDGGYNRYGWWSDTIYATSADTVPRERNPWIPDLILEDTATTTLVMLPFDGEPDDQTGAALYRGETVRLERITISGVNGIFYRVWLNGVLQTPHDRRANGRITVQVPELANFQIDQQLRDELVAAGWLTIEVIQRTDENSVPS